MKSAMVSLFLLTLAGCGTPQQQCINSVARDLVVVDQLIYELQSNISRGYAYENVTITTPRLEDCTYRATRDNPNPRHYACWDEVSHTVSRPVAIDLDAETATLASLQRKRPQLAAASAPAILACQQQYPETAR